jgi:hypothetical protein
VEWQGGSRCWCYQNKMNNDVMLPRCARISDDVNGMYGDAKCWEVGESDGK